MSTLVDTSAWIHALRRKGDPGIRDRVVQMVTDDQALWCDSIRLELWQGVRDSGERKFLREMETEIRSLAITKEVWDLASDVGSFARSRGLTVPSADLVIFACAKVNEVELEHDDQHFRRLSDMIGALRIPSRYGV
jgi:predicted nucleic acid-binding protein